jgi:hypothetical protein
VHAEQRLKKKNRSDPSVCAAQILLRVLSTQQLSPYTNFLDGNYIKLFYYKKQGFFHVYPATKPVAVAASQP